MTQVQSGLLYPDPWRVTVDGDPAGLDLALFVWRRFIDRRGERGVCCAVFRNESDARSSDLIRAADVLAFDRWPTERRHYTYVDPSRVRSSNPGYCFQRAGWRRAGMTPGGHGRRPLVILELIDG